MNPSSVVGYAVTEDTLRQLGAEIPNEDGGKETLLTQLRQIEEESRKGFQGGRRYRRPAEFRELLREYEVNPDITDLICLRAEPALICEIPDGQEDFTHYFERSGKDDEIEQVLKYYQGAIPPRPDSKYSYECKVTIWDDRQDKNRHLVGWALACPCHKGKKWSVTVRKDWDDAWQEGETRPSEACPAAEESLFLNDMSQIGDLLYDLIFELGEGTEQGLVIVAGRTAAGKSKIVRRLLGKYLQRRLERIPPPPAKQPRKPHVLTYEDPIEKDFNEAHKELIKEVIAHADYTPRQIGLDVGQLEEALNDALRQTPAVLFVAETRKLADWEELLHFAGSGHLVITTTHAGSLTEAMGNILRAAKSVRPRARSVVADRLLSVVHLRSDNARVEKGEQLIEKDFLIPALWRYTPNGAKALMAEGLSSLLPNVPDQLSEETSADQIKQVPSSIGRYWFARELTELARKAGTSPDVLTEVKRKAFEWDLEGI